MRGAIHRLLENFKYYAKISGVEEIARRYFVMNAFDGALTMLGIIIGSYFVVGVQPKFVVSAGLGAVLAMAISGFGGTFMTETAERKKRIKKIEKRLLRKLRGTLQEKSAGFASVYAALVDGVSPALAALICVFPYILSLWGILKGDFVFYLSLTTGGIILFSLGFYLGKISNEDAVIVGLKMLFVGMTVGILSLLFDIAIK